MPPLFIYTEKRNAVTTLIHLGDLQSKLGFSEFVSPDHGVVRESHGSFEVKKRDHVGVCCM